jgi:Lrp/AsnC family leucine-responsive transcriptional regulator
VRRQRRSIDKTDTGILEILQNDARIPLGQIAERLGIPKSTVYYRIRRLEDEGIILGYYAKLDATKLGKDYATMIFVRVKHHPSYIEKIGEKLAQIPGVCAVYFIFGENDFVVITVSDDREQYIKRLEKMVNMPEVERTNTIVIAKVIKEDTKIEL